MVDPLIKSQRKHNNQTEELLVGDDHFCGPEQILQGFKIHIENLTKKKPKHKWLWWSLSRDMYKWCPTYIKHTVTQNDIKEVTKEELLEAIRIINKGKSPDIYTT